MPLCPRHQYEKIHEDCPECQRQQTYSSGGGCALIPIVLIAAPIALVMLKLVG